MTTMALWHRTGPDENGTVTEESVILTPLDEDAFWTAVDLIEDLLYAT